MHLATDVAGVLVDDASSLTLAASLHPSAAVCGTPTPVADAVIGELEHMDRGRYAGPVGWIDATGDGEWGIALRCGAVSVDDPSRIRLFAGCGIVAGSDPEAEVAESSAKFVPMRDALTASGPTPPDRPRRRVRKRSVRATTSALNARCSRRPVPKRSPGQPLPTAPGVS